VGKWRSRRYCYRWECLLFLDNLVMREFCVVKDNRVISVLKSKSIK
jgi:hypothetical protein